MGLKFIIEGVNRNKNNKTIIGFKNKEGLKWYHSDMTVDSIINLENTYMCILHETVCKFQYLSKEIWGFCMEIVGNVIGRNVYGRYQCMYDCKK